MTTWLWRAAVRLVPTDWRETLVADLQDAAAAADNRGALWMAWHASRAGISLRVSRLADGVRFDVQCAMRSLARSPWFAAGAVLTFALGIGVNVAVFTAVDRVLFRALPYDDPDEIVVLREIGRNGQPVGTVPAAIADAAQRRHRGFVDVSFAGFSSAFSLSREPDDTEPIRLTQASHTTLDLFGVDVARGRDFTEEDERQQRRVALLSFDAWRARFGGADDVIGRQLWTAAGPVEIVGVLPARFIPASSFLDPRSEGFVLLPMDLSTMTPNARVAPPYVRLRPGVSIDAAQAELDVLSAAVHRTLPARADASPRRYELAPLRSVLFDRFSTFVWLVAAAAALVLAIACANLGSLMLVRNRSREHLVAAQVALGASPGRLMRAGLVEVALLAIAATVAALVVIHWSDAALRSVLPAVFSRYAAPIGDLRVVVFCVLTALVCTLVAGGYPSWRMARVDVLALLQRGAQTARAGRVRGGRSLLAVEAALTVMLVAGAVMTVRSLVTLARTDLGFEPRGLSAVYVAFPRGINAADRFQQTLRVVDTLNGMLGVSASGGIDINPLSLAAPMRSLPDFDEVGVWQVTDGFFTTMGMRVVAGRSPTADEVRTDADVAVLSESALQVLFPGVTPAEAIGRTLRASGEPARTIVGIVADVRATHAATPMPSVYLPLTATGFRIAEFAARVSAAGPLRASTVWARLRETGVAGNSVTVRDVEQDLQRNLADQRFRAVLFSTFGLTALLLAALGLYAVGAYEAAQRQREMGIRVAIGGSAGAIQWLIVRQSLAPVIAGLAVGLLATLYATRFIQSLLHQVDAHDPSIFAIVVIVFLVSSALAAWLPAHRATRLDAATILRAH